MKRKGGGILWRIVDVGLILVVAYLVVLACAVVVQDAVDLERATECKSHVVR